MSESQNNQSEEATQNSTSVFADYARYYDLLYRDKDYAAEAEYVAFPAHRLGANNRELSPFSLSTQLLSQNAKF
jgi:hypothetical protein